jgi:serine phosphatase RsbU (regulator of sigma subunit)
LVEGAKFSETMVEFGRGDAFVLYTDGVFGGANGKKPRLTPEHLAKMLDPFPSNAEALLMGMLNRVTPDAEQHSLTDDLAAVAVRRIA